MKYIVLLTLLVSCAMPVRTYRQPVEKLRKSDKVERCIRNLIGDYEVKPLEAASVCIEVRK